MGLHCGLTVSLSSQVGPKFIAKIMLPDYIETDHLKVIRLWNIDGFQGNGG